VTPTAVIQVKQGIGDVIWHLPFVRAIAAISPGARVTFLAPPSSGAKEVLAAEPSIVETIYFDHAGSQMRRGLNLIRLIARLKQSRFRTLWILDRTIRPALAARLAGTPERIGLGLGLQSRLITNPGIPIGYFHAHPIDWLRALMVAMNVPLPSTEPDLRVREDILPAIAAKFSECPRPWIVVGVGAMDPARNWSEAYWAEFLAGLRRATVGSIFIIGGAANMVLAQRLIARTGGVPAINACDLGLGEALALLRNADLFVGTDSGPMNLAAAVATPAVALFGVNQVLTYSRFIHAIVPDGGPAPGGMTRITPDHVLERVSAFL
jgi:heptosyltransferase II